MSSLLEEIFQEKHLNVARYKSFDESALGFMPSKNDIIISAFLKCGITWTEHIVWSIFHDGNPFPDDKSLHDECPRLELVGREGIEKITTVPRIVKTHLPFNLVGKNPETKYIFVVRNPKDALVSRYHHCLGFGTCENLQPLFEDFIREKPGNAGYFNFILSFLPHVHNSNVIVLKYEEIRRNTEEEIKRICAFLGVACDDAFVKKVAESTSLQSMQKNQSRWMYSKRKWVGKEGGFVRKGAVAGWKAELTEEQSRSIDHLNVARYKSFDESALGFMPSKNDIIISAFLKCGITWTEHIVWSIFHDGNPFPDDKSLHDECPRLELVGREGIEKITTVPRIVKTHLPFNLVGKNPETKYIFVVRNPKDALVSRYHHCLGFGTCENLQPLFEDFIREKPGNAGYFNFILSFLPHVHNSNVIVLKYEEIRRNTEEEIKRICAFLGVACDDAFVKKVAESTSLQSMQKNQSRWMYSKRKWVGKEGGFVRKGAVAGWKAELTEEQSRSIDQRFADAFTGTIAERWFEEEMKL